MAQPQQNQTQLLTAEELKEMIEKNKNDEGDDCLMCGS